MSNPQEPPPPYPGGYTTASDYGAFPPTTSGGFAAPPPQYGFPPAPQPYAPMKSGDAYPPQPGAYPSQPYNAASGYTHGTTVVFTQPTVAMVQIFREAPVRTCCNHCRADVVTGTHYETGTFTWIICFVMWLVGCGLGCCLIPFCVDGCKDVIHTCPNCHQQIARYSRM